MADEIKLMKQLNLVDKNNVTHEFEVKDAKAREDIESAKGLNFDGNQFKVTEKTNTVDVTILASGVNQDYFLKGDGTWVDLAGTKQDNLSAGDGIDITENIVSHSVKIIENDNYDTVSGTKLTVYLKNNKYKIISFNKTITDIEFIIEKSANNVLQETGFEFTCPEDSELENVTFSVLNDNTIKILTIVPDSYSSPNVYQGTIVNYKCTIGEYEVED